MKWDTCVLLGVKGLTLIPVADNFFSVAGGFSAAVTTPLDVAKTRIMLAEASSPLASGDLALAIRTVHAKQGVKGSVVDGIFFTAQKKKKKKKILMNKFVENFIIKFENLKMKFFSRKINLFIRSKIQFIFFLIYIIVLYFYIIQFIFIYKIHVIRTVML